MGNPQTLEAVDELSTPVDLRRRQRRKDPLPPNRFPQRLHARRRRQAQALEPASQVRRGQKQRLDHQAPPRSMSRSLDRGRSISRSPEEVTYDEPPASPCPTRRRGP